MLTKNVLNELKKCLKSLHKTRHFLERRTDNAHRSRLTQIASPNPLSEE